MTQKEIMTIFKIVPADQWKRFMNLLVDKYNIMSIPSDTFSGSIAIHPQKEEIFRELRRLKLQSV
jgi:hypothetical protein